MIHRFCKCGGSILTTEQMATDQLCDRCREKQIEEMQAVDKPVNTQES